MNKTSICFIITLISGLSTMVGSLIIFNRFKNKSRVITFCLLFSSFVMLYLSLFDLIPASFMYINKIYDFVSSIAIMAIYVLLGGIIVHTIDNNTKNNNKLYKIGIISMVSLILHNIPEGMITFITTSKDLSLGISFAISIALHNIPEGIVIAMPIYYSEGNKKKALLYTFIAALSEPFGGLISYLFLSNINDYLFGIILSFTAGVMIYLSFIFRT